MPGIMPGVSGRSLFSTNAHGIRGDDFSDEDDLRILAIGGSTTECLYLDQGEAWPALLQKRLSGLSPQRVWVGNLGKSGLDTYDHILYMKHLLPQYPRIDAILLMVGVNDMMHATHHTEIGSMDERQREQVAFSAIPNDLQSEGDLSIKGTELWQAYEKLRQRVSSKGKIVQDRAGLGYVDLRNLRRQAAERVTTMPDLSEHLHEFRKRLETMVELAKAESLRLILLTQPSMWRPNLSIEEEGLLWFGWADELWQSYYSTEVLDQMLEQFNDVVLDVCQVGGVECIDVASQLPRDTTIFYDDIHFNENGSERVAAIVFKYWRRGREPRGENR
jgi:lysophospholipase L1-like esterase